MNKMPDHTTGGGESERAQSAQGMAAQGMAAQGMAVQGVTGEGRLATVLQVLPAMGAAGGVERGTVEIAGAVVQAGGRALVASAGGPLVHDLARVGAEHVDLPMDSKNPVTMWRNVDRLAQVIRAEKVDIVHARSRAPAWSARAAAKRTGAHFVTTFHGTYGAGNHLKRVYNSIMTRGERVIAISQFIAGHIRQLYGVPSNKIRVIHRGVDLERFDPAKVTAQRVVNLATDWMLPDGMPVIMLPGRLTRWKGQPVVIDALSRLKRRDIRCLLVGGDQGREDYRAELESMIADRNLNEVVRLVDHCDDMPAAYMLTDVVISASTDPEAFGRVIAEAQALGRPVIATDHGGAKETVIPGETGWLVPPGDPDALAAAIEKVLSLDSAQRSTLAGKAIANVRDNFSKATMCAKTLDVYDEVLGIRPSA
ncbi:glycosyltransferase family 4 protein [Thalassospiraceae bacterium LMO-SO8]|nr:glycosyltransferase family 4 protein [Alphaproteobacteria bacterium LMO-S08]WND77804.1 glycosyltransferase family 4 protein [Thalassospiraceae bacterium LMO-SO8]